MWSTDGHTADWARTARLWSPAGQRPTRRQQVYAKVRLLGRAYYDVESANDVTPGWDKLDNIARLPSTSGVFCGTPSVTFDISNTIVRLLACSSLRIVWQQHQSPPFSSIYILSRVSTLTRDIDIANLSVCLSVRPWRSGIRRKRLNIIVIAFFHHTVAKSFSL